MTFHDMLSKNRSPYNFIYCRDLPSECLSIAAGPGAAAPPPKGLALAPAAANAAGERRTGNDSPPNDRFTWGEIRKELGNNLKDAKLQQFLNPTCDEHVRNPFYELLQRQNGQQEPQRPPRRSSANGNPNTFTY